MTVETILSERGAIYGDYSAVAATSQALKAVLRGGAAWHLLTDREKESLEMMANKQARAVNGMPHEDNYLDIAGYSTLAAEAVRKDEE